MKDIDSNNNHSPDDIIRPGKPGWAENGHKLGSSIPRVGGAAFNAATKFGFPPILSAADIESIVDTNGGLDSFRTFPKQNTTSNADDTPRPLGWRPGIQRKLH